MSDALPTPQPYHVSYSGLVRPELRALLQAEVAAGRGAAALSAAREIDRRFRIYPQFGEARQDLRREGATIYQGTVPPLIVNYVIDE